MKLIIFSLACFCELEDFFVLYIGHKWFLEKFPNLLLHVSHSGSLGPKHFNLFPWIGKQWYFEIWFQKNSGNAYICGISGNNLNYISKYCCPPINGTWSKMHKFPDKGFLWWFYYPIWSVEFVEYFWNDHISLFLVKRDVFFFFGKQHWYFFIWEPNIQWYS